MIFLLVYGPLTPVIWLDEKYQGARDLVDALWDELMEPYKATGWYWLCLLYTSPSPREATLYRMAGSG